MFNPLGLLIAQKAEAHCDIPCGIYDPISAKIAAQTVQKMVLRIQALEQPDPTSIQEHTHKLSRYIAVKEEHAEIVKKELRILWADYFNPTHLEAHPDLHTTFWNAEKLAGRNRQNVDMEAAQELVAAVDSISEVFWATKNATYSDPNSAVRYGS